MPFFVPPNDSTSMPASHVMARGATPSAGDGIGEARAVHVQREKPSSRAVALIARDLLRGIDGPQLGGLREADRARLWDGARPCAAVAARSGSASGVSFPVLPGIGDERGAVREKSRRAAFVGENMRVLVAERASKGVADAASAERVGRGAVEDKENLAVRFENLAHQPRRFRGPGIGPVARRMADICFRHRADTSGQIPAKLSLAKWRRGVGGRRPWSLGSG